MVAHSTSGEHSSFIPPNAWSSPDPDPAPPFITVTRGDRLQSEFQGGTKQVHHWVPRTEALLWRPALPDWLLGAGRYSERSPPQTRVVTLSPEDCFVTVFL